MNTKIYFVRHGEVENKKGVFYGRLPRMKLSEKGKEQIHESAIFLKQFEINKVYSSSLLRARQSAQIINKVLNNTDYSKSDMIIEINSYMEGKPFSFGKDSGFDHYFSPLRKNSNETMEGIAQRMTKFISKISKQYPNQSIAAVSHGDPLMILKAMISGMPMELDSIRPGKGLYIKYGEIYLVEAVNDKLKISSIFAPSQLI